MNFTRTKIICTVGPSTQSIATLRKLHKEGMNVVRINMSHANHKSALSTITKVNKKTKRIILLIMLKLIILINNGNASTHAKGF